MPLVALVLDPDDARRGSLAERVRSAGHAVVTAGDPSDVDGASPPDVVIIPGDLPTAAHEVVRAHLPDTPVLITDGDDVLPRLADLDRAGGRALLQLSASRVDLRGRRVFSEAGSEDLTEKESALLAWLVARAGQTVSREDLLVNVWGYRADMQTRTVDNTVRRLRVKVERDPAEPDHVQTVRGEGYRFEWSGLLPAPAPATPAPPRPLPEAPEVPELVGRDDAIAEVAALLKLGKRVITLLGPPGIGKTALATRVAAASAGAVFWALEDTHTRDDVLIAAASALGLPLSGVDRAVVGRALAARGPVLVVVDNAEQVCDEVAELLGAWRRDAPDARFLVTSRVRLRLGDEHCFDLAPLDETAALDLFVRRAEARRRGFGQAAEELEDAAAVVRMLEGIPLALELAASRMRVLSPADLADRLRASFDVLRDDRRGRTGRQLSLSGALASSWELLSEADRVALARLSVFRGGFDAAAAEAVLDRPDALDAVERLLDHSLVRAPATSRNRRFALFETVREYASERLDPDHADATRARHAACFVDRGDRLRSDADGARWATVLDALEADRGNIRAAFRYLLPRNAELAGRLLLALTPLWDARGAPPAELRLLEEAATAVTDRRAARAGLLAELALELGRQGHWHAAEARAVEAADLLGDDASDELRARCWLALGQVRGATGDLDAAVETLTRVARSPLPVWRVRGLEALAILNRSRADRGQAMRWLDEARTVARAHGLERWLTSIEATAGSVLLVQLRLAACIEALERALPGLQRAGSRLAEVRARGNIAIARSLSGDHERGIEGLEDCLVIARDLANVELEGHLLFQLARAQLKSGDLAGALETGAAALAHAEASGAALVAAHTQLTRGRTLFDLARLDEALEALQDSLARFESLDVDRVAAVSQMLVGRVHEERGDPDLAREAWRRAAAQGGDVELECTARLGLLAWWQGQRDEGRAALVACHRRLDTEPAALIGSRILAWSGFALADGGQLEEAAARFRRARRIAAPYPEESAMVDVLAQRLNAARAGAALSEIDAALRAAPSNRSEVRLAVRLVRRALSG